MKCAKYVDKASGAGEPCRDGRDDCSPLPCGSLLVQRSERRVDPIEGRRFTSRDLRAQILLVTRGLRFAEGNVAERTRRLVHGRLRSLVRLESFVGEALGLDQLGVQIVELLLGRILGL